MKSRVFSGGGCAFRSVDDLLVVVGFGLLPDRRVHFLVPALQLALLVLPAVVELFLVFLSLGAAVSAEDHQHDNEDEDGADHGTDAYDDLRVFIRQRAAPAGRSILALRPAETIRTEADIGGIGDVALAFICAVQRHALRVDFWKSGKEKRFKCHVNNDKINQSDTHRKKH